jgi:uncharacterized cysteine cluster protein YcgN (CxxCxxCC family)
MAWRWQYSDMDPNDPRPFWERKTLAEMNPQEWESLCDGCGLCCLQKLEDESDGVVYFTDVACKLLDLQSCRCSDYPGRRRHVSDCVSLDAAVVPSIGWLPRTCAYRLLAEGKPLRRWHHLVCGDTQAVHAAGISRSGRMVSEVDVPLEDWEDRIIFRSRT